jgi:hypothetical protein
MTDIKWEEPPTDRRSRGYGDMAEPLRDKPGEWAKVAEGISSPTLANSIKQARVKSFAPAGSFEAVSRKNPDGGVDIYARYVGEV